MNYFAHALPFLDDPYFLAGTSLPDWLTVVDRRVRLRAKHVVAWINDPDPRVAALVGGLLQHLRDDAHFHETRAFAETSLALTVAVRDALAMEPGFRPSFLGHLLTEVLLDAELIARQPDRLESYYRLLAEVDPRLIEEAVNRMAAHGTDRLALLIPLFLAERFLSDYLEDAKLMVRLNQVMRRVKCEPLPDGFAAILPDARRLVSRRSDELLAGIPVAPP